MGNVVLGYATKTEAVRALRAQGLTSRQIAARVGIEVKNVTALEASAARQRARPLPDALVRQAAQYQLDPDIVRALRPYAIERGMSATNLARNILRTVIEDGIIGAVLDDADTIRRA